MGRVIVASSREAMRRDLRMALESDAHSVSEAVTAAQAIEACGAGCHDVVILDEDIAGDELYKVCGAIRSHSELGIVVLIGSGSEQTRIDVLNAGADDYMEEPLVLAELLARVRAILRRAGQAGSEQRRIVLADRTIDLGTHKIQGPGEQVTPLTPKEFQVLQYLIARAGGHMTNHVTNRDLAKAIWGRDGNGDVEYVRVVISHLRRKIEPDRDHPRYLVTERAAGYRFNLPGAGSGQAPDYCSPEYKTGSQATVR